MSQIIIKKLGWGKDIEEYRGEENAVCPGLNWSLNCAKEISEMIPGKCE